MDDNFILYTPNWDEQNYPSPKILSNEKYISKCKKVGERGYGYKLYICLFNAKK